MEVMHAQKAPISCQALAEPPQGVGAAAVQGTRWRARMGQLKVSLKFKKFICISYNWSLLLLLLFYLDSFSSGHRKVFKESVSSCVLLYQGRYRCNILPALNPILPQPFFLVLSYSLSLNWSHHSHHYEGQSRVCTSGNKHIAYSWSTKTQFLGNPSFTERLLPHCH